jgi:hypothetical protein
MKVVNEGKRRRTSIFVAVTWPWEKILNGNDCRITYYLWLVENNVGEYTARLFFAFFSSLNFFLPVQST